MKLAVLLIAISAVFGDGAGLTASSSASDRWHVAASPTVIEEEIQFNNGNTRLVGTVYLPKTGDHLPAVVALHSAGAATRDAGLYRHLREGLPAMGFAVLIYDRRGSGHSSGDVHSADFEALADDAVAGQQAMAKLPRIDATKIGFWGLSQGGWVAILAAGRSQNTAFAVSVSAPLVKAEEQMEFAMSNLLALRGYSQSEVEQMLAARKAWTGYLHGKNSRDVAVNALREAERKPWFNLVYLPRAAELTTDPQQDAVRRKFDDDPIAAIRKTKVPLLFVYGDSDPWVPVAQSVERLQSLKSELPNIEYAVVPGANHEMMSPVNETMEVSQSTIRNDQPQSPAYFILLGSWLSQHLRK